MPVQPAGSDFTAQRARLQSQKQLLQAQRLLLRATTQEGASDTAQRLDAELDGEVDKLSAELKSASGPYSAETMEHLLRPRRDSLELAGQ